MKYLKASSIETNVARQRARLLGINGECYIFQCNEAGNPHYPDCQTSYKFMMITHPVTNEDALCVDDDSLLIGIHQNKLVEQEVMELEGWFERG